MQRDTEAEATKTRKMTQKTLTGTDFTIDVPGGTIDSSTYMYVLPIESQMTPNVSVTKRLSLEPESVADAMDNVITGQEDQASGFSLTSKLTGEREDREYGLYLARIDTGQLELNQKAVFLRFNAAPKQIFVMTATGLEKDFDKVEPLFDEMVRSFRFTA